MLRLKNMFRKGAQQSQGEDEQQPGSIGLENQGEHIGVWKDVSKTEREMLENQIHVPSEKVTYVMLFRYAKRKELLILCISATCALASGAVMPLMTVIFGQITGTVQQGLNGTTSLTSLASTLNKYTVYFVYLALGDFITTYISTVGFTHCGEYLTQQIREEYLGALLRQNMAFFDTLGAGTITNRITADTNLIQDAMSQKLGLTLSAMSTFLAAFAVGFTRSWKLTLILSSSIVAIMLIMGGCSTLIVKFSKLSTDAWDHCGMLAEEAISNIRTTTAYSTQKKLVAQYDISLSKGEKWGFKFKVALAFMIGCLMTFFYLVFALSFWEGSRLLVDGEVDISDVLIVLLAVIIGSFSLGSLVPNAQAFTVGIAAAGNIFNTLDRKGPLDPTSPNGTEISDIRGELEFKDVKHVYPSRPQPVLEGFSVTFPAGKATALVGASGCGKSTVVSLVERFYDPIAGCVLLDGQDLTTLNLKWLRQQVSLVGQEPTLFDDTIFNNIKYGLLGSHNESNVTADVRGLVENAAKMANAHPFITSLPAGYDTMVGGGGFLLSGGQKQRIAIARALVSDPKILLLDEATSALDSNSEGVVQEALDIAAEGRTTIVIAHRLSTIRNADKIVVVSEGKVVEQGTHTELVGLGGSYCQMLSSYNDPTENIADESENTDGEEGDLHEELQFSNGDLTEEKSVDLAVDDSSPTADSRKWSRDMGLWKAVLFVAGLNKPETKWMVLGLVCSIIAGGGLPVQAIFFTELLVALAQPPERYDVLRRDTHFWCLMYVMLAAVQFLALSVQGVTFAFCSERMTHRIRHRLLGSILRQDISWFDKPENTPGALTTFLSTETTFLTTISGVTLGAVLVAFTGIFAGIAIACVYAWKLALVCTATIPILLGCGLARIWLLTKNQDRVKQSSLVSASIACEAVSAIRTVASLTRENDIRSAYRQILTKQTKLNLKSTLKTSVLFAASQSLTLLCFALGFWYGGLLFSRGEYTMMQFFICIYAIIFGIQGLGGVFAFASDIAKAQSAVQDVNNLFQQRPRIDSWSTEGHKLETVVGAIELRGVNFSYPMRRDRQVISNLNLSIKAGQHTALVGASGCGKSTVFGLLMRFYDPDSGDILLDSQNISKLQLLDYRSRFGLVSQEPTLYQGTIRENILLGTDATDVADAVIHHACEEANIYDFIASLSDGLSTTVGSKGLMLSGGQKQRIAIARALIRNPSILLLDEATSALDSESEKAVQVALKAASRGRTTISIAHRVSTIKDADVIHVLDSGRVVESGTYSELISLRGKFFNLVKLQAQEK
ncbi:hypothetical protein IFR05_000674 [Cadophora sp. M221]|nr:hypothetical protein IFR05_000674 [Cadophora sp. M221]